MPTSSIAACSNDKASDFFRQGCDELPADFFDEFVTFNNENETMEYTNLPPSAYLDASASEKTSLDIPSNVFENEIKPDTFTNGDPKFYNDLMGRAAVSDTELLSLEGISLESPYIAQHPQHPQRSLPPSPTPTAAVLSRRKTRMAEALSKSFKRATNSFDKALLRSPTRKAVSSPNMISAPHHIDNLEHWGQKPEHDASKFDFNFNENSRNLTPPLTCRVSDISPKLIRTPSKPSNGFTNPPSMHRSANSGSYHTLATPRLDHGYSRNSSGQFSSGPLFPVTPQNHNGPGSLGRLPQSPPVSTFRSSSSNNIYSEMEEPLWWSHASTAKIAHPAPSGFHNPQRATKSLAMQLQNGLAYSTNNMTFDSASMASGLMIQIPSTHSQSRPRPHPHSMSMSSPPTPPQQRAYFEPGRPRPQRAVTHGSYTTAQKRHYQHHHQQQEKQYHRSARKTRHVPSDSESSSPKSPSSSSLHVRKRRSPKTNKHSTPRTPTPGGAVDFVNFTPQDSKKILTGVAPSGSSKTKARREKEAMEKRRKLSQAAVRAVRAAGGDIESLVEEGLFV